METLSRSSAVIGILVVGTSCLAVGYLYAGRKLRLSEQPVVQASPVSWHVEKDEKSKRRRRRKVDTHGFKLVKRLGTIVEEEEEGEKEEVQGESNTDVQGRTNSG